MTSFSIFHLLILLVIVLPIYFAPTIIALVRRHPNRLAISLINLVAGWSFLGWIIALIWALISPREGEI